MNADSAHHSSEEEDLQPMKGIPRIPTPDVDRPADFARLVIRSIVYKCQVCNEELIGNVEDSTHRCPNVQLMGASDGRQLATVGAVFEKAFAHPKPSAKDAVSSLDTSSHPHGIHDEWDGPYPSDTWDTWLECVPVQDVNTRSSVEVQRASEAALLGEYLETEFTTGPALDPRMTAGKRSKSQRKILDRREGENPVYYTFHHKVSDASSVNMTASQQSNLLELHARQAVKIGWKESRKSLG